MKTFVIPIGGLANRMRVVDSVANLRDEGESVTILWRKDWGLGARYDSVFETCGFVKDVDRLPLIANLAYRIGSRPSLNWLRILLRKAHVLLYLSEEQMDEQRDFAKSHANQHYMFCVIRSWEYFCEKPRFHNECFKLNPNAVFDSLRERINHHTVGVHIRRTDNTWSVENSPLELFEDAMEVQMEKDSETNFLVCSDDEKVKDYFRNSPKWSGRVFSPNGELNRGSESGILQAAGEMFALSSTRLILGSYWSSFGEIAARIGDVELQIVKKNV